MVRSRLVLLAAALAVLAAAVPSSASARKPVGFQFTLSDGAPVECQWSGGTLRCLEYGRAGQGAACKSGTRVPGKSISSRKRPRTTSVCDTVGSHDLRTLQPGKAWRRGAVKCRVAKDASSFSCRNKRGPFVLFEAADDGPAVAPTTQCADVALAPGTASKVASTGVDCAAADALVRAVAAAHDPVSGPRTFASGDWACAVVTDGTPPVGHYNCARGDAIVTWDRTT